MLFHLGLSNPLHRRYRAFALQLSRSLRRSVRYSWRAIGENQPRRAMTYLPRLKPMRSKVGMMKLLTISNVHTEIPKHQPVINGHDW